MDPILQEVRSIEFERIVYDKGSDNYFEIIEGKIPVLVSAPHGAKCFRNGDFKDEDEYTSSMAIKLGELTGAYVIFVKSKTREDSNYSPKTKYKEAVKRLVEDKKIKFLADIHGADMFRPKIDIGIINEEDMKECSCRKFKPVIEECFKDFQERLFNLNFNAASSGTVTYFAKNVCGIEAAQFEINAKYRVVERKPDSSKAQQGVDKDFKAKEEDVLEMIRRLEKMITKIAETA